MGGDSPNRIRSSIQSRRLVKPPIHLFHNPYQLTTTKNSRIFLKLENLQPSGSFKSRGIGNYQRTHLSAHPPPSKSHFYCSSGGNAGLACVTSASLLRYPSTIVVPRSTSEYIIAKIRAAGASAVIQHGDSWKEADTHLRERILAEDPDGVYLPPFDAEMVWEGHSTLVTEVKHQMEQKRAGTPDAIVCSVGGGGLFAGIMMGLEREDWEGVQVLAMETDGAQSLNESVKAGKLVSLDRITSIAKTLGAKRVCEKAFEMSKKENVKSVVLSDAEAAMGCWRFADDERMLVEPACGVSLAVCYDGRLKDLLPWLGQESKVVIVVCGGVGITLELLTGWKKEYGWIEKQTTKDRQVPSTVIAKG